MGLCLYIQKEQNKQTKKKLAAVLAFEISATIVIKNRAFVYDVG